MEFGQSGFVISPLTFAFIAFDAIEMAIRLMPFQLILYFSFVIYFSSSWLFVMSCHLCLLSFVFCLLFYALCLLSYAFWETLFAEKMPKSGVREVKTAVR